MYSVEKGISVPPSVTASRYPFKTMNVGDSFFVEVEADKTMKAQSRISTASRAYSAKNGGGKFTVRQVTGGLRVWKTE